MTAVGKDQIPEYDPALSMDEIDLHIVNYPNGVEGEVRQVAFGTVDGSRTAVLVEVDWAAEPIGVEITVGNGPPNEDLATAVPEMLTWTAEMLTEASQTEEFQTSLHKTDQ